MHSGLILDWKSIRPLKGDRGKGFEELCAQLAYSERPPGSKFVRKGSPDAGVECYAVLSDSSEWGWQAKYFDTIGGSQWSQLDESVRSAIEKHHRVVRYFVCVPLDLPDARTSGRKSAKERWEEHVRKWSKWSLDKGMAIEFVYWGSHQLLERLVRPPHAGRLRFWFDVRGFDGAWFSERLDEALRTAGPRYTSKVRVDLPIALEFEAFGRTDRFFDHIKGLARKIRTDWKSVEYSKAGTYDPTLEAAMITLSSGVRTVLDALSSVEPQPAGSLPFKVIAEQVLAARSAADGLSRLLAERGQGANTSSSSRPSTSDPFRDCLVRLFSLSSTLSEVSLELGHGESIAGAALLLLRGQMGTGKTHLLCDVARRRIAEGRPTVLLMGQRFVSHDAPWPQALQQLDLGSLSAEEFVGGLEAAAQAAGSRALLMIDAINEGAGRNIWPSHLAAFLAHLERSPWIGVVLAVRSSFETIVVPEEVRVRAAPLTHQGFTGHEYDATKAFFVHYGLELPSTPLLDPEFRNPLFLKTLCRGLEAKGERRLPRGFHGITALFDLYLGAVNERLALALDFDPRNPLVRQALEAISEELIDSTERWLTMSKAKAIVDHLLPGRDFKRSLYRGLVIEDLLVEEVAPRGGKIPEVVVFVAYERLTDHLTTKTLLDRHLDASDPASNFAPGGPLAFICDPETYVPPGVVEALCVQIPERTGKELVTIAPECVDRWGLGDAFRQSLVWRKHAAFSQDTREALNKFCLSEQDFQETLDVLLTVATLPGHPLNALFLDGWLRKYAMPDRDARWSVNLHHAWGAHSAVDRLVDWASSLATNASIDDETVDLCAVALSWMLSTANRFLRDRATQALVSLLTERVAATVRLVERFADIDDPYVAERIFAVAYGVAMRSHDPVAAGILATCVYENVFAAGRPPEHILLRDYARGVIERALHLGSTIEVVADRARPPYKSRWPTIPTEDDIKRLLTDYSRGSHDSGELEWARNRIAHSVMDDDFARYVIDSACRDWLSLTLEEPPWRSPIRPDDRLRFLAADFTEEELKAWEQFEALTEEAAVSPSFVMKCFEQLEKQGTAVGLEFTGMDSLEPEIREPRPPEIAVPEKKAEEAQAALMAVLSEEHAQRLSAILAMKDENPSGRRPPRLDSRQIKRYVLWRVFDLGWTIDRFGHFDRFFIGYRGRKASKPERIGKKYQWIAFHEIMALVADHFQYREQFREEEGDKAYEGPWQAFLRDIDPSCTMRARHGGTGWNGHAVAWWGVDEYENWGDPGRQQDWVLNSAELPKVEDFLTVTNPGDGSRWLNGQGYFCWQQRPPADQESTDVERREVWFICTGYLIRADDAQPFLKWAEGVDFWGRWMPDAAEVYKMFLGEHAWAPASRYFQRPYYGDDGWTQPTFDCPVKVRPVALKYLREAGFDCSVDETYELRLPVSELVTGLGIRWSGIGADFLDLKGRVAAQDPTVHADGPSALLLRRDLLEEFLSREKLTISWAIVGEKRVLSPGFGRGPHYPALRMSGAYVLSGGIPVGFSKRMLYDPTIDGDTSKLKVISIDRTKSTESS